MLLLRLWIILRVSSTVLKSRRPEVLSASLMADRR